MRSAVSADASRVLAMRSPVDVCTFVDDLGVGEAGELQFATVRGGAPAGAVFVESARICWAAAEGLARRLGDLLAASAKLETSQMEAVYGLCRRRQVPLGEYLVENGVVSADTLRATLLRHAAESLGVLCDGSKKAKWAPRRRGYSPRFTFTTPELLTRTFATANAPLADAASSELRHVLGEGDWGAAFVRSADRATPDPVAISGDGPHKVDEVLRLGRWATSVLDVVGLMRGDEPFLAATLGSTVLAAWRSGRVVFAARTGPHGPARMLNRRAQARRTGPGRGGL